MILVVLRELFSVGALLCSGVALGATDVFSRADAQAALQLCSLVTLPLLVLHILSSGYAASLEAGIFAAAAWGVQSILAATGWLFFRQRRARERGLLAGACCGASVGNLALPFVAAALGEAGVRIALVWAAASAAAGALLSCLLYGAGGEPFPERYEHADGGTYRGQWAGGGKAGVGAYRYPGGSRYEGEWRGNVKDGYGIFTFAKVA